MGNRFQLKKENQKGSPQKRIQRLTCVNNIVIIILNIIQTQQLKNRREKTV